MSNYYNIEKLWLVRKKGNIKESFICRVTDFGLIEIFSGSVINLERGNYYINPLSKYYDDITRMFYTYQDLISLLKKNIELNNLNFIRYYNSKVNYKDYYKFITETVKWYKYELLKCYDLKSIFIVKEKDSLKMCKYSSIFKTFIDLFTQEKIIISSNISYIPLINYLNDNSIDCIYQKLNVYSLLRLYQQINIINKYLKFNNSDEIVIDELKNKGIYEKSIIYKQKKKLP